MSIPVPLPGETTFSITARVLLRSPFNVAKSLFQDTGQRALGSLWSPLGNGIGALYRALPELKLVLSEEDTVWHHTTVPILIGFSDRFADASERQNFVSSVIAVGGWDTGPRSCRVLRPAGLRECPECRSADLSAHGIAYWHREHQIRPVARCWRHGVRLLEHRWMPGSRFELELPGFGRYARPAVPVDLPEVHRSELEQWLATAFASLLDRREAWTREGIRRLLTPHAIGLGVMSGAVPSIKGIFDLMTDRYGKDYLRSLGFPTDYSSHMGSRYSRVLSRRKEELDPILVVMLAGALELSTDALVDRMPLPTPEDATGLSEVNVDPVEKVRLEAALSKSGYVIGRTAVSLGVSRHALIRSIIHAGIRCPIAIEPNASFEKETVESILDAYRQGASAKELRAKFDCAEDFIAQLAIYEPGLRDRAATARRRRLIDTYRRTVLEEIEAGAMRNQIREKLVAEMDYLATHDKNWLHTQMEGIKKAPGAPPGPTAGTGRIDDQVTDSACLSTLQVALNLARSLEPPRRITKTLLIRISAQPFHLFVKLREGRLPRTNAFLNEHVESISELVERRVAFALVRIARERRSVTLLRLRLGSGLAERTLVEHGGVVGRLVRDAGLPVSPQAVPWLRSPGGGAQST